MSIELTTSQLRAIKSYVLSSTEHLIVEEKILNLEVSTIAFTFQLNGILRANLQLAKNTQVFIDQLDSSFNHHHISEKKIVYRVCNYQEMLKTLTECKYLDYGYMSSSENINDTQKFYQNPTFGYLPALLTIHIPQGAEVLDLNNIKDFDNNTYEHEILFKRNSLFNVVKNQLVATATLEEIVGKETKSSFESIRVIELNFERYLS